MQRKNYFNDCRSWSKHEGSEHEGSNLYKLEYPQNMRLSGDIHL